MLLLLLLLLLYILYYTLFFVSFLPLCSVSAPLGDGQKTEDGVSLIKVPVPESFSTDG